VVLLVSGLGACGGGGDSSTSPAADSAAEASAAKQAQADAEVKAQNEAVREEQQRRQAAEAPTPEETEAKETATDFYAVLDEDKAKGNPNRTTIDSASFCELMSEQAVEQTIEYAKVASGVAQEWDCEAAVELLVVRSKKAGAFESVRGAEVLGVNAEGDKATATVRFGSGPATALPMVKEDGEWKLAATPVGAGG
jgi:hypothetical protein